MDKLLERHKLRKLSVEDFRNINRPIACKEIELIILKNFPQSQVQPKVVSLVNSTKHLRKS